MDRSADPNGPRTALRLTARIGAALLALVLVAYAAAAIWLMSQETRLVFQAGRPLPPARPATPFEQIDIPRSDGLRQFAWIMPAGVQPAAWVLFLHGNAATVASRPNIRRYERLRALGVNVFAPEYRGYAGLDGTPSEERLYTDARTAYDYLRSVRHIPSRNIVVYGWSLGAAVAVHLATEVEQAGVILEGAPASLVAIGQRRYPLFPIRWLMRNPFDAVLNVGLISSPLLFLHSPEDEIVPFSEGRRLFDAARTRKTFVEVRGGHINAADVDSGTFFRAVQQFLAGTGVITSPDALPPSLEAPAFAR